ncbi:MAG: hypothetical protein M0Z79_00605 [Nitrospiraceae bacterium]|nr:hypothetical protein [Nitrospiraceae bacterium]
MEVCYRCGKNAEYICPDCGAKACRSHMENRYVGPDRGFKSRYMCPVCWKGKRVVLNENMLRADQYAKKVYIVNPYGKGR